MDKLIIFIKNPILGKVKTRLAATIGEEKAMEIYLELMNHTLKIAGKTKVEVNLFFSDEIMNDFPFPKKYIQKGNDLGERMRNAFDVCFAEGGKKIVIIGTDCAQLKEELIEEAFSKLDSDQAVIGPALDGGYYLFGMREMLSGIFEGIEWSTSTVFSETKRKLMDSKIRFSVLKELRDIDTEDDLFTLNQIK
jgi:rSAM/selenodomain-associated transferase 1